MPRRKQAHAKQIIAQKQENATKKANFAAKLRSVCAEDHKRAISKSAEKQEFAWIVLSFWCKGAMIRK